MAYNHAKIVRIDRHNRGFLFSKFFIGHACGDVGRLRRKDAENPRQNLTIWDPSSVLPIRNGNPAASQEEESTARKRDMTSISRHVLVLFLYIVYPAHSSVF